ncbi:MAG: bifunctional sugar-1-phosphate nucleotidylyltransferase/acetyltransferase [Nanobdellota archaeon]
MKAVILAAGRSTRTYPLTMTRPKPLLKVANKTLLEHNLDNLVELVDEILIVVGYKKEMIMDYFGDTYKGIKLKYIVQEEALGTGHALLETKKHLSNSFIVLNGDDLYSGDDLNELSKQNNCALVVERENPSAFGVFMRENNKVTGLVEKPQDLDFGLCNIGCYVLDTRIFEHLENLNLSSRGEYEITDAIDALIKDDDFKVLEVKNFWIPVTYAWNLLDANEFLLKEIGENIQGEIEDNVQIKGELQLGKNSRVMSGTYIEGNVIIGQNCKIGPNAYIRGPTSIGDNCRIGPSEIKACVFFDDARCDHVSYIGDSVLGQSAHIGAHTITANLRHDKSNISSMIKEKLIDTGRRKLGVIFGDSIDTGINTSFYPGRKMGPNTYTVPSDIVKRDVG